MTKKKRRKVKRIDIKKGEKSWPYSKIVSDHFFHPRNVLLDEKDYKYDGKGTSGNVLCGDVMALWIKVDSKTQRIKDCKWRTLGCASAIAVASMMSVMVTEKGGMLVKKASNLKPQQIIKRLGGLPALKFHCSVLGLSALKEAIDDYLKNKQTK